METVKYKTISKKTVVILLSLLMAFFSAACGSQDEVQETDPTITVGGDISSVQEPSIGGDSGSTEQSTNSGGAEATSPANDDGSESTDRDSASDILSDSGEALTGSNILVAYFSRVGNTVFEDGVDVVASASLNLENGEFVGNAEYLAKMAQEITGGDLFLIKTEDTYPSAYRDTTDAAKEEQNAGSRPALTSHVENMDQYDAVVLIYPCWWGELPMPLYTFLEEYDFSEKTILPLCTHEGSGMGSSARVIARLCPDANLLTGLAVRGSNAPSAQSDVKSWINDSGILNQT